MHEADKNGPSPRPGHDAETDAYLDMLFSPPVMRSEHDLLRDAFQIGLTRLDETLCSDRPRLTEADGSMTRPLTLVMRQRLNELENSFREMIDTAGGTDLLIEIQGRFTYRDPFRGHVHSLLVQLSDLDGSAWQYDGPTGALNQTKGACLVEVLYTADNTIFVRHQMSVDTVRHEIGRVVSAWPEFVRLDSDRQTSPLFSRAWSQVQSALSDVDRAPVLEQLSLYADLKSNIFCLRFDCGQASCVVQVHGASQGFTPTLECYRLNRPVFDLSFVCVEPFRNERGEWDFSIVPLLSVETAASFSQTVDQINRPSRQDRMFGNTLIWNEPLNLPLSGPQLVNSYLQVSGEDRIVDYSRINRVECLGTPYHRPSRQWDDRAAVGFVATTAQGHFVLNSQFTRAVYEYGPVATVLVNHHGVFERILPLYSLAAFREELGRLKNVDEESLPELRQQSYLLHLATRAVRNTGAEVERVSAEGVSSDSNRIAITLHFSKGEEIVLIERNPGTSLIEIPRFSTLGRLW